MQYSISAAIDSCPNHANTLYNYAVMLDSHCNRRDEAEELYHKALSIEPHHPYALYNLAVLLEDKYKIEEKAIKELSRKSDADSCDATVSQSDIDSLGICFPTVAFYLFNLSNIMQQGSFRK
jgi:tetratricopeptide (TPR) repeat protein